MLEKTYTIEGMSCQHCVKSIELELKELNLESFIVDVGSLIVKYKENNFNEEEIIKTVKESGYNVK